ncbi:MAG: radical SAM protein [Bacteroidales bacterium]|nr:radical SAM protein [Bacteroidales bacterium]
MFWKNKIKPTITREILQDYLTYSGGKLPVCRAPFTSLYFFPDGQVGSCCLNKSFYTLGVYPENSINKIIKSKKRTEQQKYILANNLSNGCQICNENINSGNYSGVMATDYNKHEIGKNIKRIDFELSDFCNLDCLMCERDKKNKNSIYNDSFFEELKPYLKNLEATNFLGGEPFLIDIYYKIWDYLLIHNKNCNINIQSNGTVINDRIIELVSNEKVFISLSIDSVNKSSYEKIRKGADFDKMIKNFNVFNNIMKKKSHSMYVSVCPIAYNAAEIPEIVKFANESQCRIFFNRVVSPTELSLDNRSEGEYKQLLDNYYDQLNELSSNTEIEHYNKQTFGDFVKLIESLSKSAKESNNNILSKEKLKEILLNNTFYKRFPDKEMIILKCIESISDSLMISTLTYDDINSGNFEERYFALLKSSKTDDEIVKLFEKYFEIRKSKEKIS